MIDPTPSAEPIFTHVLVAALREERLAEGPKAQAFETHFRHSDAGKCSRHLALKLAGVCESNPFDLASDWVTSLGTLLHEQWQEALLAKYPDAQVEVKVRNGDLSSGHIDLLVTINGKTFCYELKTRNGYAFSKAVGVVKTRGGALVHPAGPSSSHVIQASLNALGCNADYAVIGYLALESISIQVAANLGLGVLDRILAEWVIPRDVYEGIAHTELERLEAIRYAVQDQATIPMGVGIGDDYEAVALDPNSKFRPWQCTYCSHLDICKGLDRMPVFLEELVE
jgi:hypothetical protein